MKTLKDGELKNKIITMWNYEFPKSRHLFEKDPYGRRKRAVLNFIFRMINEQ